MPLKYPHLIGGPIVQDPAVGGSVERSCAASHIQVYYAWLRIVAVYPS